MANPDRKFRIILADDTRVAREATAMLLESLGHEVVSFASGEAALEHLEDHPCDIFITDNQMPGIRGMDVLKKLREDPRFETLPVIMISADNIRYAVEKAGGLFADKMNPATFYEAMKDAAILVSARDAEH